MKGKNSSEYLSPSKSKKNMVHPVRECAAPVVMCLYAIHFRRCLGFALSAARGNPPPPPFHFGWEPYSRSYSAAAWEGVIAALEMATQTISSFDSVGDSW